MRDRIAGISGRGLRALLAFVLVAAPGVARAQVAEGVIEVLATDETGERLPGVTVTVTRPDTGLIRIVTTGQSGGARVPALPPAAYQVKLELAGFANVLSEVVLRVGQSARLEATLKLASVSEVVTVSAEVPLVDVRKTDSSTNVIPEQIQSLPVADRDFQRLAFITPGVQRERGGFRFIAGGPVIGGGGNASQSTVLVDGVDLTDPSLGLARVRFSQDAIGEFRVIANRFDTEVGNSAGGALSIVTKSGTNSLRGTAFGFFRDKALRSKGDLEQQKADFSRQQYGFTLGGPVVRDRTHFFASFEQVGEDNVSLFRPGGAFASRAADIAHPFDQSLAFAGLDQRINDRQQLKAKVVYERYRESNFRVGGVGDQSSGMQLNRDNWNVTLGHTWTPGDRKVNSLGFQFGGRKFDEPPNSTDLAEFFSSGNTLITGENLVGGLFQEGTQWEVRDTFTFHASRGRATHDIKAGAAVLHVSDRFNFPVYPAGLMIYVGDTRAVPLLYVYGEGSGDARIATNLISGFVQDEFRPRPDVTLNLGLRYDLDTAGNNPDFTHPLVPAPRGRDTNNIQPRFGFSWDVTGQGGHVVRGGVGLFTGRFLLVPSFGELQQNGITGRVLRQRLNGAVLGIPALTLNPASPRTTGVSLPASITLLDAEVENPQSTQATLGWTARLGGTGLYLDLEGIYVRGRNEVIIRDKNFPGNAAVSAARRVVRPNTTFDQVNTYTNDGRSEYKAAVASLNGAIRGGHLVTASVTLASKKNINDDFSPALVDYPSDPADIEAEFGRSRGDERFRAVVSGVFRLPWRVTVSSIFEYGSGQPWNPRLGYDVNGDGRTSDRAAGVERFSEDGPRFSQLSLRVSKNVPLGAHRGLELIAEAFNLLNTVNHEVNSIQSGQFLSGPTLANPALVARPNPRYGQYVATLPPREIQLGLRLTF